MWLMVTFADTMIIHEQFSVVLFPADYDDLPMTQRCKVKGSILA